LLDLLKRTLKSPSTALQQAVEGHFELYLPTENVTLKYQLKLSKRRRSLSVEIKHNEVLVKAPYWTELAYIEAFLIKKQSWIVEKKTQQTLRPQNQNNYQSGSKILLLGQWITLIIVSGSRFNIKLDTDDKQLVITQPKNIKNPAQYIRNKLILFYSLQAQEYITPRFKKLQTQMQVTAKELQFKLYKRRWGCCYASGLIRINPMIMGAPDWVIDCVLVHELSHLPHMNHSANFWQLNKDYCPQCDSSKKWLFEHSQALSMH
jgi:predicted metal-dependent hydrolase